MRTLFLSKLAAFAILLAWGLPASAEPDHKEELSFQVIDKYVLAMQERHGALNGTAMEVQIDATLSKHRKTGRLSALRRISQLGQITYKFLSFTGDDSIKRDVIGRYLTAETQAKQPPELLAITPANYQFKYKGIRLHDEREAHIFEVKPKKKKVGLFKGELWIDAQTYLPLRESGEFVKNPSVFLKKIKFIREYRIQEGLAVLRHIESTVETRVVGKAEIAIDFNNMTKQDPEAALVEEARVTP